MELFEFLYDFFELTEEEMEQLEYCPTYPVAKIDPNDDLPY